MKKLSKIRGWFGLMMVVFVGLGFLQAQNVNTLSIEPSTLTGRYFCPIDLSVVANYNGGSGFTNCQYNLLFDPSGIQLGYASSGDFLRTDTVNLSGNILSVEEASESPITTTAVCSHLILTGIVGGSTVVQFVTASGNTPTSYDFDHTQDLLNLSYNGSDTLTGVQNLSISFYKCPCELDNEAPKISEWSHDISGNTHYTGAQNISFLVYDKSNFSWPYWTNGVHDTNYYTGGAPIGMDNQEGINSGSIEVELYVDGTLLNVLTPGSGLIVTRYTGTIDGVPMYTWDGYDRGYWITLDTHALPVETPIAIVITVSDNTMGLKGGCTTDKHTTIFTGKLNEKQAPTITFNSPIGQNINPNVGVKLTVADSWAGVDTGSLVVEILPIMSGGQEIMPGSIYSGDDLTFVLTGGSEELGGASVYEVAFQPIYEFAVGSTITISGYVMDLIGMETHAEYTFRTREDCTFYGCVNFVDIFSGSIDNLIQPQFTGSLIVVTGTLAPYPYLTGENNDIVMCGPIDGSINLTGNIDIYSGDVRINGNLYPYEDLYVTGLDFEYQSGVITPIY